ncbi:lytic transglycosylase domain-containing protein [Albirhodobacter sp. R86504]|uniref:lytic transglycosylase domain-containing protein n=1 Tax=Albirhodobacter sp. R86504 TaxID=3093848 RepID=UPI0036707171
MMNHLIHTLFAGLVLIAPASRGFADAPEPLARALQAADAGDWVRAESDARTSGPLAFDIMEWHRLRAGEGAFADYADFATRREDWPGMELLRRKGESKLADAPAAQVLAYFAENEPITGTGALALVAAHGAMGDGEHAAAAAAKAWRSLTLSSADEAEFLTRYAEQLAPHHDGRMAMLLDAGDWRSASRMLDHVSPNTRAVAQARIALQSDANGVDALVAAVPHPINTSAGLAKDRADWRARKDFDDAAIELILERSVTAASLGDPRNWASIRARLARLDLRNGNARRAYRLASNHHLNSGEAYADLEWISGYAALKLGDGPTALGHFQHLETLVESPISSARAGYWEGRALEHMGRTADARAAYARAAAHQTAYYGLLAAEKIGGTLDPTLAGTAPLPDWKEGTFRSSSVFEAAVLLHDAGADELARRFILHLSESLGARDIAGLAKLAQEWNDPTLAVRLAKRAATDGLVLTSAYFPLTGIEKDKLSVPPELALAIARRESEFDATAGSPVGARGLMQLMPGTAKMMASKLGVEYDVNRLTNPDYNAQLGAEYLATLRAEFGSSPVLVAVGYNAGPGRSRRWMEERGDPREPTVDIVDWVEMIPFSETRNYVMRVAESLPVYRMRLGAEAGPVTFSQELRGQ